MFVTWVAFGELGLHSAFHAFLVVAVFAGGAVDAAEVDSDGDGVDEHHAAVGTVDGVDAGGGHVEVADCAHEG